MKHLGFAILISTLIGCATGGQPISTSVYLLNTDRGTTALLNSLSEEFKKNKYEIDSRSNNLGVLTLKPRRFVIPREEKSTAGVQTVQVRQEGGSVKVSMSYRCEDPKLGSIGPCLEKDAVAIEKIAKIEKLMIDMFNKHMYKTNSDNMIKSKLLD